MKSNKFLDSVAAAKTLSALVLAQADRAFPRQRSTMTKAYHLRNGIFSRV